MATPVYQLRDFSYSKSMKSLCADLSDLNVPVGKYLDRFQIESPTGKIITFAQLTPDHPKYDEDGWDGEMRVYAPTEYLATLETVTIINS